MIARSIAVHGAFSRYGERVPAASKTHEIQRARKAVKTNRIAEEEYRQARPELLRSGSGQSLRGQVEEEIHRVRQRN